MKILGVDFTSAPRKAKPIIAAWGHLAGDALHLDTLQALPDWAKFEALLATAGPWVGAFDLPFGLPREMVQDLAWPTHWPDLVRHCEALGKAGFTTAIDHYRAGRAPGHKFAHRATDHPAGSSSPMKLINPPVGLMFLEGAPRLLAAGVHIPCLHPGDDNRIALEGYPGYIARSLTRASYKSDTRQKQTPERAQARHHILDALTRGENSLGLTLRTSTELQNALAQDPSGDCLDATLCALQAAWSAQRQHQGFGLPQPIDPIEGWIATVPQPIGQGQR